MYATRNSRNARNSKPPESPFTFLFEDFRQSWTTFCRDRIAPTCTIRHPVWPIVALQRRVGFSARLAGFVEIGVTRDALAGLNWPHFRFSSLISIFECHVCAKGGEWVADRGPCSVALVHKYR